MRFKRSVSRGVRLWFWTSAQGKPVDTLDGDIFSLDGRVKYISPMKILLEAVRNSLRPTFWQSGSARQPLGSFQRYRSLYLASSTVVEVCEIVLYTRELQNILYCCLHNSWRSRVFGRKPKFWSRLKILFYNARSTLILSRNWMKLVPLESQKAQLSAHMKIINKFRVSEIVEKSVLPRHQPLSFEHSSLNHPLPRNGLNPLQRF